MGIDADIALFRAKLNSAIKSAMEGIVADTAKGFLIEAVETEVYRAYTPSKYKRRGADGGLKDPRNIEARYDEKNCTLEVENMTTDHGYSGAGNRRVAPIVESGRGYTWDKSEIYAMQPYPRPFHKVAEKNMAQTGEFERALNYGLLQAGMDAEIK